MTNVKLTLILLTWKIRWAPNNASKWQMGFNSAFKGLKETQHPINRRLIGPQNNEGLFEKIRIYCPLSEFEFPIFRPAAWSLHRSMIRVSQFHNLQESFQNYQVWRVLLISDFGAYVPRLVFDNFGFHINITGLRVRCHVCWQKHLFRQISISPPLPYQIHNEDTQWNKKKNALVWRLGGRSVAAVLHRYNAST